MSEKNVCNESVFTREERAKISKDFRDEIKLHGLSNAILSVLTSNGSKTVIKRTVLYQQCRKKNFLKEFEAACKRLEASYPKLIKDILELQAYIKETV